MSSTNFQGLVFISNMEKLEFKIERKNANQCLDCHRMEHLGVEIPQTLLVSIFLPATAMKT